MLNNRPVVSIMVSDLTTRTDNLSLSEMDISSSDDITTAKVANDTGKSLEKCDRTEPIGVLYRDKYHAFLAHSNIDAVFVESVMDTLEKRGVSCCYSKRDFRPGTPTVSCIDAALEKCSFVILFLSKDFLTSPWCEHEREMALQKATEMRKDIIVPILIGASLEHLPMNMRRLTHIRSEDIDFEKKLLFSLGCPEGNSRPTYSDLETAYAELKTKLEDAQAKLEDDKKLIKMKDDALVQQQIHIKQCEAEASQCGFLRQMLVRKAAELKEIKSKLDRFLNEKSENKQQQMSGSALKTTVDRFPIIPYPWLHERLFHRRQDISSALDKCSHFVTGPVDGNVDLFQPMGNRYQYYLGAPRDTSSYIKCDTESLPYY